MPDECAVFGCKEKVVGAINDQGFCQRHVGRVIEDEMSKTNIEPSPLLKVFEGKVKPNEES
jgi:hypothetical protein